MEKIFLFGDSHFGSNEGPWSPKERENLFFEFIKKEVKGKAQKLILLGDIFDFWFEYKSVVPKYTFDVLENIFELASQIEVHFVCGNHDLWAGEFFQGKGIHVHKDNFSFTQWGKKFLFSHGDRMRKKDLGGRIVRFILGNRISISLFSLIHPDAGIGIARIVSKYSRGKSSSTLKGDRILELVKGFISEDVDLYSFGHFHYPLLEKIGNTVVICTGDWIRNFTYAVIERKKIRLFSYLEGKIIKESNF